MGSKIIHVVHFIIVLAIYVVNSQYTSGNNCVYTFHVPRNSQGETCPSSEPSQNERVSKIEFEQMKTALRNLQEQLTLQTSLTHTLLGILNQSKNAMKDDGSQNWKASGGINYVRYGSKSCPATSSLLYEGYVAKSSYNHAGGGVNFLCLPQDPEWPSGATSGYQSQSYIYGVEYEHSNSPVISSTIHDDDVPCAVCEVSQRSQKLMIPAKESCPEGWIREYYGMLMAEHHTHHNSAFVCVDFSTETIHGGSENKNGGLLYVVEAVCGSLSCPPYEDGYELSCVVCTK